MDPVSVIEDILRAILRALPSLSGDALSMLLSHAEAETQRRLAADAAHLAAQATVDRALQGGE